MLRTHVANPGVCKHACWALLNVCWSSSSSKKEMLGLGGVSLFEEAIRLHSKNADKVIVEKAKRALEKVKSLS